MRIKEKQYENIFDNRCRMVRQVNQDYVYVTDRPLGILQNLFVVADGMGGHQAEIMLPSIRLKCSTGNWR